QGSQVAYLQNTGTISQTLTLAAGTYRLSLLAAQRGGFNTSGQTFQVYLDDANATQPTNAVGDPIKPAGKSYQAFTIDNIQLTGGSYKLWLVAQGPAGEDNTALIDSVSIELATPTPVTDGGFETPAVGNGAFETMPSGSAWTFAGTSG